MNQSNDTIDREIVMIPIDRLHPFPKHPYQVLDNEEMDELINSIQVSGILTPIIVRPMEGTDREYEVISGHRRVRAAQKAGMSEVPASIFVVSREEAAILLVDSNLHREHILPSEKAFAYKLKYDAMKHQGQTSGQLGQKLSREEISKSESGRTVQRYLRLTHLVPPLLDMVDQGKIAFSVGVELSYLARDSQLFLAELIAKEERTPSYSQAVRMHRESGYQFFALTNERIAAILAEEKPNQREQIRLRREEFGRYFPPSYSDDQIKQDIMAGLDLLRRKRLRDRDSR